jgi:hypothetical protein
VKKAERIMDNFMRFNQNMHTTFAEVVSWLILKGTGYDGRIKILGKAKCHLNDAFNLETRDLLGFDTDDDD